MALKGAWPATLGGFSGFPTSCPPPTPNCFVPASFVPLNSLIGNFPVSEHTDLYSLRLDHNLSNNNRVTLRAGVSPSDQTGIQVQAQGPQNFGQNSFSRTSVQNYHDWNIAGQDTLDHRHEQDQRTALPICPPGLALRLFAGRGRQQRGGEHSRLRVFRPRAVFLRATHRAALSVHRQLLLGEGHAHHQVRRGRQLHPDRRPISR